MPELPEVESIRRALAPRLTGRGVSFVRLRRCDIVRGDATPAALLAGARIAGLRRRGKQLAMLADDGRAIIIQLGMSGQLLLTPGDDRAETSSRFDHVHVEWTIGGDILRFRDPRRFGGITTFSCSHALEHVWTNELGPDALSITAAQLRDCCRSSRRAIKARLLDQHALAGVGNIYADEALFEAGVRPRRAARSLTLAETDALARAIRAVLRRAIDAGGSTLRDYITPDGTPGSYQLSHLVYDRAGKPCLRCGTPLVGARITQRSTTWCPKCQR